MPARAGSVQTNSKDKSKPLRWHAIGDFWTFPTKTIWRMNKFAGWSRMHLECTMISLPWWRSRSLDGMIMYQDPLAWWIHFCRRQLKAQGGKADRRRDGKINLRMERNGIWRFPEVSGRQGKEEKYFCNVNGERTEMRWDHLISNLKVSWRFHALWIKYLDFFPFWSRISKLKKVCFRKGWFTDVEMQIRNNIFKFGMIAAR